MSNELKMKVSLKPYNELNNDIISKIKLKNKYVSDGIGENFYDWTPQNPVLISAQTGMGKNTFIEKKIITHAAETYRNVLIISNRTACNRQQKNRIASITRCQEDIGDLTAVGLDKKEDFNNIRIVTYQKLGIYLDNILESEKLKNFHIIVFDEVHFFISDALFNNQTSKIFEKCLSIFQNSIRIYMTATPDEVFPIIVEKETELGHSTQYRCANYNNLSFVKPKEILLFDFQRNYKYILPKYFENKDEILELIKNDRSTDKWLVFVTNRQDGEEFIKEIGNNSIFIDSNSKNSSDAGGKIYEEIITQEKYSCKVLVCTSVLDNGINFKDDSLINIVIFSSDKTEFIQMLGRKRLSIDEKITVYIYARSKSYFNAKLFTVRKQIQAICCFKESPLTFASKYFSGTTSDHELVSSIFYFDKKLKFHLNVLAEKKLFQLQSFYKKIIDELSENKNAFILEQLSWLGLQKTYDPTSWVSYVNSDKNKANFLKFLDENCDIPLSDKAIDIFGAAFKTHVDIAYGKKINDRADRPVYGVTKMRNFFKDNNLQYFIVIQKGIQTLRKL